MSKNHERKVSSEEKKLASWLSWGEESLDWNMDDDVILYSKEQENFKVCVAGNESWGNPRAEIIR